MDHKRNKEYVRLPRSLLYENRRVVSLKKGRLAARVLIRVLGLLRCPAGDILPRRNKSTTVWQTRGIPGLAAVSLTGVCSGTYSIRYNFTVSLRERPVVTVRSPRDCTTRGRVRVARCTLYTLHCVPTYSYTVPASSLKCVTSL